MNLDELAQTLPNGFHDAELSVFTMDYTTRTLRLDLDIWTGAFDEPGRREAYRPARVTLRNVAYLAIEPPDTNYPWLKPGAIRTDAGLGSPTQSAYAMPEAPAGSFRAYFYLGALNSFLQVAAERATLNWTGDERCRG